jgi:acyl-ACP thioesterase
METFLEKKYKMRYFEMNKFGMASPITILTLLEETAADHCYNIGYSLYNLEKQNIGWILISGTIDMIRYPQYKEEIIIKTWLSKYSLVKGYRENIIFDNARNIIGKAKGIWAFYDIKKRKP